LTFTPYLLKGSSIVSLPNRPDLERAHFSC
jgi:hypothetical protein